MPASGGYDGPKSTGGWIVGSAGPPGARATCAPLMFSLQFSPASAPICTLAPPKSEDHCFKAAALSEPKWVNQLRFAEFPTRIS
jgi:hypothetical protein